MTDGDPSRPDDLDVMVAAVSGPPLGVRVRRGLAVTAALTVLTIIEYLVAVEIEDPLLWLLPFVAAKFVLILEYFMHLSAFLGKGGH